MRELIIFIAYQACSGRSLFWGKNPFQYQNALRLLGVAFTIHLFQVGFLISNWTELTFTELTTTQYLIIIGCSMAIIYGFEFLFPKNVLVSAIEKHKGSSVEKFSKMIAVAYTALNIFILVLIILIR